MAGRCDARKARPNPGQKERRQHHKLPRLQGRKKQTLPSRSLSAAHGFGDDERVAHCASQQGAVLHTSGGRLDALYGISLLPTRDIHHPRVFGIFRSPIPNSSISLSTPVSHYSHCQFGAVVLAPTIDLIALCKATDLNLATLLDRCLRASNSNE